MAVEKICPECGARAPSYSPATGHQVWVTYFRCGDCRVLFYLPSDDPDATPVIVAHGDKSVRS